VLILKAELWIQPFSELLGLTDYAELSVRAYDLRSTRAHTRLKETIRLNPNIPAYRHIRHYLGRLASWAKSTHFIVEMTRRHGLLTRRVKVRCVGYLYPTTHVEPAWNGTALQAMSAALTRAGMQNARQACVSRWQPLLEAYSKRWESLSDGTTIHAEITVLDHFYRHDLTFAYGTRYIGCSKPSCFCCGIYMSNHPLNPQTRPCHNNVWIRWSPPQLIYRDDATVSDMYDGVMRALTEVVAQKIRQELSQETLVIRQRVFDSVTDISTSLPTIFDPMTQNPRRERGRNQRLAVTTDR
jgi:hypothetical protein